MNELDNIYPNHELVQDDSFVSLLKAELAAMHDRRLSEQERIDPIYMTLKDVTQRIESDSFYDVYGSLSDPEKYAIISRFENRQIAERHLPSESKTIPQEVNIFVENERKKLGVTTTRERNGRITEITDLNKITELRRALNDI